MTSGGNNFNYFPENRTSLMLHFLPYAKKFSEFEDNKILIDIIIIIIIILLFI